MFKNQKIWKMPNIHTSEFRNFRKCRKLRKIFKIKKFQKFQKSSKNVNRPNHLLIKKSLSPYVQLGRCKSSPGILLVRNFLSQYVIIPHQLSWHSSIHTSAYKCISWCLRPKLALAIFPRCAWCYSYLVGDLRTNRKGTFARETRESLSLSRRARFSV